MPDIYIGIDLGGTNIRFIVYDKDNDLFTNYKKHKVTKFDKVEEEVNKNLVQPLREIVNEQRKHGNCLRGIGLSVAAVFERDTGNIVEWSNNPKYKGFPMRKYLEDLFHVVVYLEDDANAAAFGELWKGASKNSENFVYITVGTGIGCGIIINGKLLYGSHGWAGELGHIYVTDDKDCICSCKKEGCLQAVSSGTAIVKRYKKLSERENKSCELIRETREVVHLAEEGDETAVQILASAGNAIGKAIANIAVLLDVSLFVLGGGVIANGDIFTEYINKGINQALQNKRKIEVKVAALNDMNGMMGVIKCMI